MKMVALGTERGRRWRGYRGCRQEWIKVSSLREGNVGRGACFVKKRMSLTWNVLSVT